MVVRPEGEEASPEPVADVTGLLFC